MTDKLLIGTSRQLIYWDGSRPHVVWEDQGLVYGITWGLERLYVVTGETVRVLDGDLRVQGELPLALQAPHQAYWWEGALYVANVGRHEILRVVEGWNQWTKSLRWPGRYCDQTDRPHANSIWRSRSRWYVAEHWRMKTPKRVRVFDQEWRCLSLYEFDADAFGDEVASGIHNVYAEGGQLYTLGPGRVLALGLDGGGLRIVAFPEFAGGPYLRGLARTDRFYVGVSRCGERAERHGPENDSAVLVLDDDLVEVGRIELQGTGQLCEVRALDGDRAHNRLPCPFRG